MIKSLTQQQLIECVINGIAPFKDRVTAHYHSFEASKISQTKYYTEIIASVETLLKKKSSTNII